MPIGIIISVLMKMVHCEAVFLLLWAHVCWCQLIVNVRNGGGEVYTEKIDANTTQDSITLEFRQTDGTLVTQFIDWKNEIHIFRVVTLPELELGYTQIQTLCFILRLSKSDFIASDAMSKLRQKNPGAVRHPEEMKADELSLFDSRVSLTLADSISPHIADMCADASHNTYARSADIRLLAEILNRNISTLESSLQPLPSLSQHANHCSDLIDHSTNHSPCLCRYNLCIGWYPCGLKHCRGKDSAGRIVSYRCGIQTCGLCRVFEFPVAAQDLCEWDLPNFDLHSEGSVAQTPMGAGNPAGEFEGKVNNMDGKPAGIPVGLPALGVPAILPQEEQEDEREGGEEEESKQNLGQGHAGAENLEQNLEHNIGQNLGHNVEQNVGHDKLNADNRPPGVNNLRVERRGVEGGVLDRVEGVDQVVRLRQGVRLREQNEPGQNVGHDDDDEK